MEINRGDTLPMLVCSIASLCAVFTIIVTYVLFPDLHGKSSKGIVFYLALSNFFASIGSVVGEPVNHSATCWFEGIVTNIFTLSSVMWTTSLCFTIFTVVILGKSVDGMSEWTGLHLLCWGIPVLATFLPLINATYGAPNNMGWCWVIPTQQTSHQDLLMWYWISFYGVLWFGVIVMFGAVIIVLIDLASRAQTIRSQALRSAFSKLAWYPVVIVVCWALTTVYDNMLVVNPLHQLSNGFRTAANVIPCCQGILTALIFWWANDDVRLHTYVLIMTGHIANFKGGKHLMSVASKHYEAPSMRSVMQRGMSQMSGRLTGANSTPSGPAHIVNHHSRNPEHSGVVSTNSAGDPLTKANTGYNGAPVTKLAFMNALHIPGFGDAKVGITGGGDDGRPVSAHPGDRPTSSRLSHRSTASDNLFDRPLSAAMDTDVKSSKKHAPFGVDTTKTNLLLEEFSEQP